MNEDQIIRYLRSINFNPNDFRKTITRGWYDDNWTETVTDWEMIGKLIDAIYEAPKACNMIRVNGDIECDKCGKPYSKHPDNLYYLDHNDEPFLKEHCDGILLKL